MRRVMAVIGFSSFFISLFCIFGGLSAAILISVASIVALALVIAVKKLRFSILILLFISCLLSSVNFIVTDNRINEYKDIYCHDNMKISGVLVDYPETTDSGFVYTFKTNDKNKVKFTVMCPEVIDIEPGDIMSGTFDFSDSYADYTDKIYFSAYAYTDEGISVKALNDNFNISKFRKTLKQGLIDNTTIARGLTKAIVFGDKSGLTDELYNDLLRCGLLHTTATSGLHLTVVTGFVFALLSFLGFSRKKSSAIAIVFIILFMIVIGFKFSLMRAGIMMIIYFAANLFDREGDGFNSIGMVLIILLAQNIYTVTSCSFLLSVSAVIGMLLVYEPMYQKIGSMEVVKFETLKKLIVSVLGAAAQSVVAIAFTMPVTYIFFGYFSIAGILANAILSPFISIILISGVIISVFSFVPVLPAVLGGALDMVCLTVIKIVGFISKFKYCLISIDYDYIAVFFFVAAVVISVSVLLYYFYNKSKKRLITVATTICFDAFLITVLMINLFPAYDAEIKMQNSSGNICITAMCNDKMLVIDTGGNNAEKKIKNEMVSSGIDKISMVIAPSSNSQTLRVTQNINNSFKVEKVICNTDVMGDVKNPIKDNMINIKGVSEIKFGKIKINIIKQEFSDVLYLTNDKVSVLIIDRLTDCNLLSEEYKKCDTVVIKDSVPDSIDDIEAESAVICTYDKYDEMLLSSKFKTYSLRTQAIEFKMTDKLIVKKV